MSRLSGFAVEHDMVFGEWLLSYSLELVLVLLLGGLVLQSEETRGLAHPLRPEGELEVLLGALLDEHLAPVEREGLWLALLQGGDDLPLLAGVVDDRDILRDVAASWHAELELGLDLLRDGGQLVLIEPDVGPVEGLEYHITGVRSRFGRVAGQLEGICRLLSVSTRLLTLELVTFSSLRRRLLALSSLSLVWKSLCLVLEGDAGGACEEWVRDLDLKELLLHGHWFAALGVCELLGLEVLLPLLGCLVHDLVSGLLQLVVLEVEHLAEAVRLLRVAVALKRVEDLGQLSLADDGVLELSNSFIGEDHVAPRTLR